MFKAGQFVMSEVDLIENPWANAGKVVGTIENIIGVEMVSVQWPELPEPVWEIGWMLRVVDGHGHSPIHDREVSIRDQQRIDAAELSRL